MSLSKTRTEQYKNELEMMKSIIPFDQLTTEGLNEVFPDTKLDKKKHPYWPHKPIENLNVSLGESFGSHIMNSRH